MMKVSATVMRNFIEQNRDTYAPLLPGQLTLTARHQEPIDPHKSR